MALIKNPSSVVRKLGEFKCPCGQPLEIMVLKSSTDQVNGKPLNKWAIGHFGCDQSPAIHGLNITECLKILVCTIEKYGRMSSANEHKFETSTHLLCYDRTNPTLYDTTVEEETKKELIRAIEKRLQQVTAESN